MDERRAVEQLDRDCSGHRQRTVADAECLRRRHCEARSDTPAAGNHRVEDRLAEPGRTAISERMVQRCEQRPLDGIVREERRVGRERH